MTELLEKLRHCAANKGIIMNRKFLLSLSAAVAVTLGAHAQLPSIATAWAKTLDTTTPDMGIDATLSSDGSALYYFTSAGSLLNSNNNMDGDPTLSVFYDGQKIATGAPYDGNSYNNNLSLVKTDLEGNFLWSVYSTSGEIAANNGGVAPAPDGGVFIAAVMRHTDNMRTSPITLVDATGNVTTIPWTLESDEAKRYHRGLLMKVSAGGAIEHLRLIDMGTEAPTGDFAGTGLYLDGCCSDDQGNFYVSGRYVTPMTLATATGTTTLTPHNTDGWDGDTQKSRGDIFLAKFNGECLLTASLTTTGAATVESSAAVTRAGDDIYLNFTASGASDTGSTITLDGHSIVLPTTLVTLVTARLDTHLHVKWATTCTSERVSEQRVPVFHYNRLAVAGDNLWITGMAGNLTLHGGDFSATAVSTGLQEGFAIKCDAATGRCMGITTCHDAFPAIKGINAFVGGFEDENGGNFYAYGYSFGGQGVFLCGLDASSLQGKEWCTLVSGGGMPTAQKCIATGNTLYTISRGRTTPDFDITYLKPIGNDTGIETRNWGSLHCAFTLPFNVREDTAAPLQGDVDGNGVVNGSDVTALYNFLLNGDLPAGLTDVDGNGTVNGSDVTALYNLLLQ